MTNFSYSTIFKRQAKFLPNGWDIFALTMIFALLFLLAKGTQAMSMPFTAGQHLQQLSLAPSELPNYALRTVMRMFIAMAFSLLFTFVFATAAAKSRRAEQIIIPFIDIAQSVPVLGFQAIAIVPFITLFSGSLWGPEFAAIFAIFTAQAWNMALSFYQSLVTVPHDLREAAKMFQLSAWQKFWKIEVPCAMPGLLWNAMLSMSAGWFFVVESEAITVAAHNIILPGIGSYIALAIQHANIHAVVYAILAMLIIIALYDQLIFRPLVTWSQKFRLEESLDDVGASSWVLNLLQKTHVVQNLGELFRAWADKWVNFKWLAHSKAHYLEQEDSGATWFTWLWYGALSCALALIVYWTGRFITHSLGWHEIGHVFALGAVTGVRVLVLIVLCSLVWVPVGVYVGMRPRLAQVVQPIAQFLTAFPANLLFPLVVIVIVKYHLNVEIWTAPLMILGTQWYILFNVVAGASVLPKDLYFATENFGVKGWLWWKRFILPGIFPFFITGAITAAGGAWNASIVAEVVSWGHTTLTATGVGAYITHFTNVGDFARIALGISVMCFYVLLLNRLLWQPLYRVAEKRFGVDSR